jgi:vacuolar-type H+-ATPase subunit I/STV1
VKDLKRRSSRQDFLVTIDYGGSKWAIDRVIDHRRIGEKKGRQFKQLGKMGQRGFKQFDEAFPPLQQAEKTREIHTKDGETPESLLLFTKLTNVVNTGSRLNVTVQAEGNPPDGYVRSFLLKRPVKVLASEALEAMLVQELYFTRKLELLERVIQAQSVMIIQSAEELNVRNARLQCMITVEDVDERNKQPKEAISKAERKRAKQQQARQRKREQKRVENINTAQDVLSLDKRVLNLINPLVNMSAMIDKLS